MSYFDLVWVQFCSRMLWHVDMLLGSDREIGDCTVAAVRQRLADNNRGMVFSVQSVPICFKQGN
jgi:hypothetical protein